MAVVSPSRTSLWPFWLLSVLLVVSGAALIHFGLGAKSESERFRNWQRTTGQLIELRIVELATPKRPGYRIAVRYQFQINGRSIEGRRVLGSGQVQTAEFLKREINAWLENGPADWAHDTATGTWHHIRKIGVPRIPIIYLASDPAQSFAGVPSTTLPHYGGPMSWTGGLLLLIGVFSLGLLLNASWRESGPFFTRAAGGFGPEPTESQVVEFVERIDAALLVIRQTMAQDKDFSMLKGVVEQLEEMKQSPGMALANPQFPGWSRWLVGELGMDNWGSSGRNILNALDALNKVHAKHHAHQNQSRETMPEDG